MINAIIDDAGIIITKSGNLTYYLQLLFANKDNELFGCIPLDFWSGSKEKRISNPNCAEIIRKILEIAGVNNWKDLKGRAIRVKIDREMIIGIGHIVKNIWFYPPDFCKIDWINI